MFVCLKQDIDTGYYEKISASTIRHWFILLILSQSRLPMKFEALRQEYENLTYECSEDTLHKDLQQLQKQGYIVLNHNSYTYTLTSKYSSFITPTTEDLDNFCYQYSQKKEANPLDLELARVHKIATVLNCGFEDADSFDANDTYLVHGKESPYVSSKNMNELCDKIQLAIDNHYYVKFTYRDRKNQTILPFEVEPHLLYHNVNNGRIYLISMQDSLYSFRLDLMLSFTELPQKKCTTAFPADKLRLFDHLWGMDLSSTTEAPCHVKLRIDVFNHNMLEKIKNDTSRRKYARLYQDGAHWYYEDDIIGLSAFRAWIYQFGYSVMVLSPESLAREVYESAVMRVENHKKNRFLM